MVGSAGEDGLKNSRARKRARYGAGPIPVGVNTGKAK